VIVYLIQEFKLQPIFMLMILQLHNPNRTDQLLSK